MVVFGSVQTMRLVRTTFFFLSFDLSVCVFFLFFIAARFLVFSFVGSWITSELWNWPKNNIHAMYNWGKEMSFYSLNTVETTRDVDKSPSTQWIAFCCITFWLLVWTMAIILIACLSMNFYLFIATTWFSYLFVSQFLLVVSLFQLLLRLLCTRSIVPLTVSPDFFFTARAEVELSKWH